MTANAIERVVEYYDECHDDYRVLWRIDETSEIHFGYFEDGDNAGPGVFEWAGRAAMSAVLFLPTIFLWLLGTSWTRELSVRCARFAARGAVRDTSARYKG